MSETEKLAQPAGTVAERDASLELNLERHELSDLFPRMRQDELTQLTADIEANGLRDKIVLYEGKILDGYNRYRALRLLGTFDRSIHVELLPENTDPLDFVISRNLHRRHLSTQQRAKLGASIANLRAGRPKRGVGVVPRQTDGTGNKNGSVDPVSSRSTELVARQLDVSPGSIKRAKVIIESGDKEVEKAVFEDETISLAKGYEMVKTPWAKKAVQDSTGSASRKSVAMTSLKKLVKALKSVVESVELLRFEGGVSGTLVRQADDWIDATNLLIRSLQQPSQGEVGLENGRVSSPTKKAESRSRKPKQSSTRKWSKK